MKKMSVFTHNDARSILEWTDSAVWNVIEGLKKKEATAGDKKRDVSFGACPGGS